jgi:GT2 family glycosyltransferase
VPSAIGLSVVIVTFNSRDAIEASLPPLIEQLQPRDELIVVDNASSDGTSDRVRELAPQARLLVQDRNLGFAGGCNAGAAVTEGELLVFLNPDAVAAPGFAEAIRRPLTEDRGWGAWMGFVTAERGAVVNTSGGVVHFTGIAWAGQAGDEVAAAPALPHEVPFASGACLAVPRDWWNRLGGFPDDFFMYCEDVEFSLRLWLWGGRIGVEPSARVDHDYEFAKGAEKWRLLERNRWATVVRIYPGSLLTRLAPALLATELALFTIALASGWGPAKLRATWDTLAALPRLLSQRRAIQAQRELSTVEFARLLTADLTSPYLGGVAGSRLLRGLLRAYWTTVLASLARKSRRRN